MNKQPMLFRNTQVLDLDSGSLTPSALLVKDGVLHLTTEGDAPGEAKVYDAQGAVAVPGLLDIHVHLREPGDEDSETIASGTAAAAKGGFTAVASMANTSPPIDDPQSVRYVLERAREAGNTRVYPIAAVSRGLKGDALTEMFDLADAGAVAFSDDGLTIMDAGFMRRALEYSAMLDKPIVVHAEDCNLKGKGNVHEGFMSTKLGLRPVPRAAEEVIVSRDIRLAKLTGARLHIAHVSCAGTVAMIREAQSQGMRVTGEVTPHHLIFTDQDLATYDTNFKMAPPLREGSDREALIQGLKEGVIQAVATDHAPHTDILKEVEFDAAPNGVVGVETAFASLYTGLVKPGHLDLHTLIHRMTTGPAQVMDLDSHPVADGGKADFTLLDLDTEWQVTLESFVGKSANSPWLNSTLAGRAAATVCDGDLVFAGGLENSVPAETAL